MIIEPFKLYTHSYRNPTSNIDGFVTVSGNDIKIETFKNLMLGITIKAKDNNIFVQLSNDGINFDNKIMLEAKAYSGDTISLSFNCKAVKITNEYTGGTTDGRYQVIGWNDD